MASNSNPNKILSSFGQVALTLDAHFKELDHLGSELEHVSLDTEKGLERAKMLLQKFSACGQNVTESVQALAVALEESRTRAEKTAQQVSAQALLIQKRHNESEHMLERFQSLGLKVREVIQSTPDLKKSSGAELSFDEKTQLANQIPAIDSQLAELIEEAAQLRQDARQLNMRELERSADSLTQSLQAARRKLSSAPSFSPTAN